MSIWQKLRAPFGIDLRTLALFRAGLGAVILFDLLLRSFNLSAFYTDGGVLPRNAAIASMGSWRISLYLLNGGTAFAAALFLIEAACALCILAGYRTRLMLVLTLLLHGSLLNRNPTILDSGDTLICCLLFWSIFLPTNARWSADAALAPNRSPQNNLHISWASAALVIQVLSVYYFNALLKTGPEWMPDGTTLYYAMSLQSYSTGFGQWLLNFPALLHGLSYFIWFIELCAWVLVLSPVFNRPLRFAAMLMLMALHIGLLLFMRIVPFPFIGLTSLTVLLGSWFWDWLDRRHAARGMGAPQIYYDRNCSFCLKMCLLLQQFLVLPRALIAPAQDTPRAKSLLEANNSWVIIDTDEQAHLEWSAFVILLKHSPLFSWLWRFVSAPVFVRPGNAVYHFVARHRSRLSGIAVVGLPQREVRYETGTCAQKFAAAFLFIVLAWNFALLDQGRHSRAAQAYHNLITPLLSLIRIDQIWDMAAPALFKDNGWYVIPGELEDGTPVNVRQPGEPVSYDKPASVAGSFGDLRWKTYLMHLWSNAFADQRALYSRWLCQEWNSGTERGRRLKDFKIIYMLDRTPPPGLPSHVEQVVLWTHSCNSAPEPLPAGAP
ncbi:MAG: DCC1-like thiol-disulfide oxidoreductase family protein [Stenotrophobium sp.]